MIRGVLYDMDGVLIDSEEYICKAAIAMFREKGIIVQPADFKPFVGTGENRYIGGVAEKYAPGLDIITAKKRTYELYDMLVTGNIKALPGAVDLVRWCRSAGLKTAVATSADRIKMDINLREMGLGADAFDATVNGDEVEHKKPAPDIFIRAAEKIGIPASECLVIEDAINGIKAGKAAGCKVLAVTTSFPAEALAEADWVCESLQDYPPAAFRW
ncbi:MAG: HAD-IA family hydrolase [Bacteroidales bacterium]